MHIAFAEAPYDAGEHIRGKSGGFDPTVGDRFRNSTRMTGTAHMSADNIFPIMEIKRTFLRPYLSEKDPMCGETKNCRVLQY